ncbi:MAG TPA: YhdP family protein [Gallionellaceae bacterium]|nr:YhdP family protein [Gallionellaceae bacterium]
MMRVVWLGSLLLVISGIGTVLLSRYYLFPHIEDYHDQIAYAVGSAFDRPVTIGKIEADWEGFRPHLLMINVRVQDQQGATALALERVESEVAWTSLFTGQLRLYSLILDQPDLSVKRDAHGELFVAGMAMSGSATNGEAADWLLNQSRIEVRDARVTWEDEMRAAPPLVFNDVNLLIDNGWRSHRFAFRALPPKTLSAQVDVRGDFRGASFGDIPGWRGELFAQLDYADVAAWGKWLPLPVPLSSGKGALRGWLEIRGGKISSITADLALSNVNTRLAPDLPVIALRTLHGRVGWRAVERGMEVSTRNLSLRLRNGFRLSPTDFYLRYALKPEQGRASGEVRANKLDLLGLSTLSEYLPFNRGFKRKLAAFDPRGQVTDLYADWDWQGDADKLLRFSVRGQFSGMAMKRVGGIPGFSGLTGRVDGNDGGGDLAITSRKLTLETAPEILPEKIRFDSLVAQINWETGRQGLKLAFNNVTFSNPDLQGVLNGSYRTVTGSPGAVDMTAHLNRAVVKNVDHYIPIPALGKDVHAWLASGLVGGRSDDVNVRLAGDLAKFPFPDRQDGEFLVQARLKDAAIEFRKDWPSIENIDGELKIDGTRLAVTAPTATTLGNPLQNVSAVIPDLVSPDLSLQVYGESLGDAARALEYTRKSPVRDLVGGFTDKATARGNGQLKLRLDIPLAGTKPVKVDGRYRLLGTDVDLAPDIPLLQQARGDILFTDSSVATRDLAIQTLGGPAKVEVSSSDGGKVIRVKASGNSNMDVLRTFSTMPVLRYLHGGSPWELGVTVQHGETNVLFTSSLVGTRSDLPAPFDKPAADKMPFRFEQTIQNGQNSDITVQYGDFLNANVIRIRENGAWRVRHGVVAFGKHKRWPQREGLWLTGEIPHLSLVGWSPLLQMIGGGGGKPGSMTGIDGADLLIHKVTGFGQKVTALRLTARSHDGELFAQLSSREISGQVVWQPQAKDRLPACLGALAARAPKAEAERSGRLAICLRNLAISDGSHAGAGPSGAGGEGKPVPVPQEKSEGESPQILLEAGNFAFQGKKLGRLEVMAQQSGGDWSLEQVHLETPDGGEFTANGKWLASAPQPRTALNFTLVIRDAGAVLSRSGYPGTVKKAGGSLSGALSWAGGPGDFYYSALDGSLRLKVGQGQFLKIAPDVSGLLRILSLQAFNLAAAFSQGFVFDSISGTATIKQGVLTTQDFEVDGAPAKVTMVGQVDLNNETQNLRIVIEPKVRGGTTMLFAIVGTPVGALTYWLIDKILGSPVEKIASVKFDVTGTWAKPNVSPVGERK